MNMRGVRTLFSGRFLIALIALLFFAGPSLYADKKPARDSKPAAAPAKASPAPRSVSSGGGSGSASHNAGTSVSPHTSSSGSSGHGSSGSSAAPSGSTYTPHSGSSGSSAAPSGTTFGTHGGSTYTPHGGSGSSAAPSGTTFGTHGGSTYSPHSGSSGTPSGGTTFGTHGGSAPSGHTGSYGSPNAPHGSGSYSGGGHGGYSGSSYATTPHGFNNYQTRSGASFSRRPDGRVATFHDERHGMEVHHGLGGSRTVIVERTDHTRIYVVHGGPSYVQRPYMFHGHEYATRYYYHNGVYYHAYYGRYAYHGVWINPYFPSFYYRPAFYGWVYNPWVRPVYWSWGWYRAPWYGYYGGYFRPYPTYTSASLWLTDYLIATSLEASYQAQLNAQAAALYNPAPLTPEVKQMIADEVRDEIAIERGEGDAGANATPDAASSSVQRLLSDGRPHVFVAGAALDVTDMQGAECALSEGDALQFRGSLAPDAQAAQLAVLASKGGRECPKGDVVSVALADLQDMQNHMRQVIDQGMQDLQQKQGQGGLPAAPAGAAAAPVASPMAASAPAPPPANDIAAEINQQSQSADQAEKEAAAEAPSGPGPNGAAAAPQPLNIVPGETVDQVTAALGQPERIVNSGAKTIYIYKDIKVTFTQGKVTDVE